MWAILASVNTLVKGLSVVYIGLELALLRLAGLLSTLELRCLRVLRGLLGILSLGIYLFSIGAMVATHWELCWNTIALLLMCHLPIVWN